MCKFIVAIFKVLLFTVWNLLAAVLSDLAFLDLYSSEWHLFVYGVFNFTVSMPRDLASLIYMARLGLTDEDFLSVNPLDLISYFEFLKDRVNDAILDYYLLFVRR